MDMKKYFKTVFFSLLLAISFPSIAGIAAPTKAERILAVIHSYALDYEWTAGQDQGITKALIDNYGKNNNWKIERFFLDSKKLDPDRIDQKVHEIKKYLSETKPSAAILTDDLAFQIFFRYLRDLNIPVSFSGINGNLRDYGYHQGEKGITGSLEKYNIVTPIKILKKLRPSIKNILLVADASITGKAVFFDFKSQIKNNSSLKELGILELSEFLNSSYERLQSRLKSVNSLTDGVVFAAIYSFRDRLGRPVSYKEINEWLTHHTDFLDVGASMFNVKLGRLISLASSEEEMGYYTANSLFSGLKSGKDISEIPIRQHLPLQLTINHTRADKLGVSFPYELLVYAANSGILYERKGD